jgi:hypothetical protein
VTVPKRQDAVETAPGRRFVSLLQGDGRLPFGSFSPESQGKLFLDEDHTHTVFKNKIQCDVRACFHHLG